MSASGRKGFLPITVGKNLLRGGNLVSPGFELLHFVLVLSSGLNEVNGFCRDSLPLRRFPLPPSSHAAPAFTHCCCEPRSSLSRARRQSHDVKDVTKEDGFTQASSVRAVIQLVRGPGD
eukprot:13088362-Alexandrium_andersonii.AAC.1